MSSHSRSCYHEMSSRDKRPPKSLPIDFLLINRLIFSAVLVYSFGKFTTKRHIVCFHMLCKDN